jgi:multidrug efflux pump subunit AcrB
MRLSHFFISRPIFAIVLSLFITIVGAVAYFVLLYLSNYATLHIKDAIARLDGVGDVQTFGARDYAMRIWLDPAKVAADDLTAGDVVAALRAQNVQVSAGVLAQPPVGSSGAFQIMSKLWAV